MKNLILLLSIISICYSCKKETMAPLNFTPKPPKDQRWRATIQYTEDSLNTYFKSNGGMEISIIDSLYSNGLIIENRFQTINTPIGDSTYKHTLTTVPHDVPANKPLTYWIKVYVVVQKPDLTNRVHTYYKKHTFVEGDNGIVNFNTLP